ncbi:CdaR family transcriptional regulator [Halobacillus mangrovi]|uniref:CdaR family transcriptional regulator n=1 Tax=Halobacillus mangrovi TaxID=402384 RepID=UPI003D97F4C1
MELTDQLGKEIIRRLSKYIDVTINLMNAKGKIVASTDPNRIDQLHGGAQTVIETTESQFITKENIDCYSNVKPGANLPIFHRGKLAGVVGLTGDPEHVVQAAGMTQGSVEIALEQIFIQRQAFYQERQWSHWLQRLLQDGEMDHEDLESEAKFTLRVDVHQIWQVGIFQSDNPFELAENLRKNLHPYNPLFVLPFQENRVIVPFPYDDFPIKLSAIDGVKIGIGEPGYSVAGVRSSYYQAKEAIELSGEYGKIVYSKELEMERLLNFKDSLTYDEVTKVYRQRFTQLEQAYIETLTSYFDNDLKMSRTAEALHIHRNTLIYRLDQIHKKIDLDPRKFKDAILLQSILLNT